MLFDFHSFIEELREKKDKKEIVEKYENIIEPIAGTIREQAWYREYVSRFSYIDYEVPKELKDDFDWQLLMQLVVSSFSTEYSFRQKAGKEFPELLITVSSGDEIITRKIGNLLSSEILEIYGIYIEETINLHILKYEDEKEKAAIDQERDIIEKKWKYRGAKSHIAFKSTQAVNDIIYG